MAAIFSIVEGYEFPDFLENSSLETSLNTPETPFYEDLVLEQNFQSLVFKKCKNESIIKFKVEIEHALDILLDPSYGNFYCMTEEERNSYIYRGKAIPPRKYYEVVKYYQKSITAFLYLFFNCKTSVNKEVIMRHFTQILSLFVENCLRAYFWPYSEGLMIRWDHDWVNCLKYEVVNDLFNNHSQLEYFFRRLMYFYKTNNVYMAKETVRLCYELLPFIDDSHIIKQNELEWLL